jgi:hypothetical protein
VGKRIYPLNPIKYWWVYDIEEICDLYKKYKLHHQTVIEWIRKGLPTIDKTKPALIYGYDLKAFLGNQNLAGKFKTEFHQIFCRGCKEIKEPYKKQVQLEHKKNFVNAKARCPSCKKELFKSYKLDDFQKLKSVFCVVDVLQLYDCANPALNTQFLAQAKTPLNEPAQGELF